jgi:toxin-antitoxin system PIN domain toxin
MLLTDVNVLIYAFREDSADHAAYRSWLDDLVRSDQSYGVSDHVLSGFLRIVTSPRIYKEPTLMTEARAFAEAFRGQPNAVQVHPGNRHWEIFSRLCDEPGIRGNLVSDAFFAALAMESGSEWITSDGDFARFPGLSWRRPF